MQRHTGDEVRPQASKLAVEPGPARIGRRDSTQQPPPQAATGSHAAYPAIRMRRTRAQPWSRRLVAEHALSTADLIWPIFLIEGENKRVPVASMPGVDRLSVDHAVRAAEEAAKLGIPALDLFPYIDASLKNPDGREALNAKNLVCRALRAIKAAVPGIGLMCDVALDPYTSHGHDGILSDGAILNDATVAILVEQALLQADAGADIIGPSDMMDGRVGAIRSVLEAARPREYAHHVLRGEIRVGLLWTLP